MRQLGQQNVHQIIKLCNACNVLLVNNMKMDRLILHLQHTRDIRTYLLSFFPELTYSLSETESFIFTATDMKSLLSLQLTFQQSMLCIFMLTYKIYCIFICQKEFGGLTYWYIEIALSALNPQQNYRGRVGSI